MRATLGMGRGGIGAPFKRGGGGAEVHENEDIHFSARRCPLRSSSGRVRRGGLRRGHEQFGRWRRRRWCRHGEQRRRERRRCGRQQWQWWRRQQWKQQRRRDQRGDRVQRRGNVHAAAVLLSRKSYGRRHMRDASDLHGGYVLVHRAGELRDRSGVLRPAVGSGRRRHGAMPTLVSPWGRQHGGGRQPLSSVPNQCGMPEWAAVHGADQRADDRDHLPVT